MRTLLFSLLMFSSASAFATKVDCDDETIPPQVKQMMTVAKMAEDPGCPNPKKIKNICMTIDSRTIDPSPMGDYKYMYQRKLLDASCVDMEKDSEEVIASKISKTWKQFNSQLICNNVQFDVSNGNLLKYAVSSKFDNFIGDVIRWKVDLNKVDETDQRTVLDYVKFQIDKNKGNPLEEKMKIYYRALREAGAKHKSEL